ncbi:hypothetical protein JOE63_003662 [Cellulosimicrobium cellulans]|nr:hypothetical protein [Cellulosimicrobium cellulans]
MDSRPGMRYGAQIVVQRSTAWVIDALVFSVAS